MNWQAIETAPRDGTVILVHVPYARKPGVYACYYDQGVWKFDVGAAAHQAQTSHATHWMPLPELPQ